jgi:O-antigen ligase
MLFVLPFRSSVALRNVLLCATIAGLAALTLRGAPWRSWMPARRVLVPILLLAAWCVASTAWSVVPQATARELWPEVVAPLLAFFAFHALTRDAADLDRWAASLAAGLMALAALAVGQELILGAWDPRRWHVDVGYYTTHVAVALPLVAWLWLRRPARSVRTMLAATLAVTLVVMYWTDNRVIWPTLAAMGVLGAWLGARDADAAQRRRLAGAAGIAVAIAAFVFVAAHYERNVTLARQTPGATAAFAQDPRLTIWPQALARWQEAPWAGRGFGRPALALPPGSPADGIQDGKVWHAHNVFLDVALELGLVGLGLFLAMLAALVREALPALRAPPPRRWAAITALTALLAFVMKDFPDDFFVRHISLLCASLAGMFAGYLRALDGERHLGDHREQEGREDALQRAPAQPVGEARA